MRVTGEQRQFWGNVEYKKQQHILDFGRTGEQANLFYVNEETGTPHGRALMLGQHLEGWRWLALSGIWSLSLPTSSKKEEKPL